MHVDIDAFFASVEQVRNPHLRGRPVIVGSGCIASCSYEAREYGLEAGMPLRQARELCPRAVVLKGHYPTYRCFSRRVFERCRDLSCLVETHLDEAYCDLTGSERLLGDPRGAARKLKRDIHDETGLTVSVGIGTNRMVAQMAGAADKPDGLNLVEKGREAEFIRDLPIEELPGVGRKRLKVLRKLNIDTIADLRLLDKSSLRDIFGADGAALYERCRGRDSRAIEPGEVPESISRQTAFHEDTTDMEKMEGMLHYLVERAARSLRELGLRAGTVGAWLRYGDSRGYSRSRSMPSPTDLDEDLSRIARDLLQQLHTRRAAVHTIGVELSGFCRADRRQSNLFEQGDPEKRARLRRSVDDLRRRFGHSVVMSGKTMAGCTELEKDRYGYVLRTPSLTK
jgi:DNA polymerase-4